MRTSEIRRFQRASYPSAGIPPAFSDNGTGRKECAGCRSVPGGNKSYIGDMVGRRGTVSHLERIEQRLYRSRHRL